MLCLPLEGDISTHKKTKLNFKDAKIITEKHLYLKINAQNMIKITNMYQTVMRYMDVVELMESKSFHVQFKFNKYYLFKTSAIYILLSQ